MLIDISFFKTFLTGHIKWLEKPLFTVGNEHLNECNIRSQKEIHLLVYTVRVFFLKLSITFRLFIYGIKYGTLDGQQIMSQLLHVQRSNNKFRIKFNIHTFKQLQENIL